MTDESIKAVGVVLQDRELLLPASTLAEVIPLAGLIAESCLQRWILGHKHWKNLRMPVISFELLAGGSLKHHTEQARIAVFNRYTENGALSFWGMLIQGEPRVFTLNKLDIAERENPHNDAELMSIQIRGQHASIPNLEYIEKALAQAGAV